MCMAAEKCLQVIFMYHRYLRDGHADELPLKAHTHPYKHEISGSSSTQAKIAVSALVFVFACGAVCFVEFDRLFATLFRCNLTAQH